MDGQSTTEPVFPLVGKSLKHYQIESPLGQGGMGLAYRAFDTKLQRPVALKVLSTDVTSDPDRRKRFLLEARAAARVIHPAIAQIYDVDEHDGTIFIAMELVEGSTVRELIQRKALDTLGTIDLAIQVAEGLAKAHEAGIVHRDIKPANVILTPDGQAKILDFGLAKLIEPCETISDIASAPGRTQLTSITQTQIGAIKGTPAYMSPEQVKCEKVDPRSDLFSLGIMIFEMATWESPFRRSGIMETMHAVAFDETPSIHSIRTNLPGDLQRIVSRCLRKRPEDRYPDARSLAHDLRMLRRESESGRGPKTGLRQRLGDAIDRIAHLRPGQYAWLIGGILGLAAVIYLLLADVGLAGFIFLALLSLYVYRHVRHQPRRMLERFIRKVSRLPEVRLIAVTGNQVIIAADQPVPQLYARINEWLNYCNQKLFFGDPLSLLIRHDFTEAEVRQILASPGVQYVRDIPEEPGPVQSEIKPNP